MTHSESSVQPLSLFAPATLKRTLNRTFHSLTIGGTPLMKTEKENSITLSYDTIPLSSRRFPGQRLKHGFQQVDAATGHRQQNAGVTCGGSTGSHSKLSHLWSLRISQPPHWWLRLRVITACRCMCFTWKVFGIFQEKDYSNLNHVRELSGEGEWLKISDVFKQLSNTHFKVRISGNSLII